MDYDVIPPPPPPTVLFIPYGVNLDAKPLADGVWLVTVDGCKPSELRMWQGNVEVRLRELDVPKKEGD